jgi:peptide/nickel transport system permease protein
MREGSRLDRVVSSVCVVTASIPTFASTVFLSALFVFQLHWLPGTSSMIDGFSFKELILPVLVLVLYDFGYVARITRASMVEVMTAPYIRTAVLKGLPYRRVILRHALRNALITPFTAILLQLNFLFTSVVVTEAIFGFPGFGRMIVDAALNRDVMTVEAATLFAVFVVVTSQIIGDFTYMLLNPRIRFT